MAIDDLKRRLESGDGSALTPLIAELDAARRGSEATDLLSAAANKGNAQARFMIGARLLTGFYAPVMPQDGIRLITESADKGYGEAAALLAVLTGMGAYVRQSWKGALDLLQRSAQLGFEPAQRQLSVISGQPAPESAAPIVWKRLREAIDISAWTSPPALRTLSESPRICTIENFMSPAICDWQINRAKGRLQRAQIYTGAAASVGEARTNTTAGFTLTETDLLTVLVQARIAAAAGVAFGQLEALTVLHYAVGEVFSDHFDFVDPRSPSAAADIARYGQRVITFIIYLNDGYEGGETAFPRVGISHKGGKGDAIFFVNTVADGAPDLRTLHAGRAPTSGEKWIVTQFIRSKAIVPGTTLAH